MNPSDMTHDDLVKELSALREQMAILPAIESEKARAEEKARQSNEQFRELAAHIHQVLWIIDAKTSTFLYVSPAYETIWGRTGQSLLDKPQSYLEGYDPLDRERIAHATTVMYQTGNLNEECRVLKPDGSARWVRMQAYPVKDQQDKLMRIVGVIEDMTERRATDQALHICQERDAAILRASLDAILIIDHENKIVDFNTAAESIFGYSHAQAVGKDMSDLIISPPMRQRHKRGVARSHAPGEGLILNRQLQMPARRADGTQFWCELTVSPIEGKDKPLFIGFMRDITEQKALQDDQARLAAIGEFSMHAIVSKTADGIIITWNSGAERLYGYSANEMIGHSISVLFAPDHFQEYTQIMKSVKKGMSIPSYDTVRRRKDGTEVSVSVGISPIKKREGEIVEASIISENITKRKASEEQTRLLLESTGEGIYGIDMQGRCTFINQAAAAMLGYAAAAVIGQEMHSLIH